MLFLYQNTHQYISKQKEVWKKSSKNAHHSLVNWDHLITFCKSTVAQVYVASIIHFAAMMFKCPLGVMSELWHHYEGRLQVQRGINLTNIW